MIGNALGFIRLAPKKANISSNRFTVVNQYE